MVEQERVFISYTRRDGIFARRLYDQLTLEGFTSWADWEGLSYSVEWWAEIKRAIERCENFLCILSPIYFASRVCNDELAYALSLGKRVIPVVRRNFSQGSGFIKELEAELLNKAWTDLAHANLQAISVINYHFFLKKDGFECVYDDDNKRVSNPECDGVEADLNDFATGFRKLYEDIIRDPAHISAHTRLTVRAVEWDAQHRTTDVLLLGDDLKRAEVWLESWTDLHAQGRILSPEPTDLHRAYITASADERLRLAEEDRAQQARELELQRQATERQSLAANRLRYLLIGAVIFLIVSVFLTAYASIQQGIAVEEANRADNNAVRADARAAEAQSLALAADSQRALAVGDSNLALALALESISIPGTDPSTINALRDALSAPAIRRIFTIPEYALLDQAEFLLENEVINPYANGGALPRAVATDHAKSVATLRAELKQIDPENKLFLNTADKIVLTADEKTVFASNHTNIYAWEVATGRLLWVYPPQSDLPQSLEPLSATLGGIHLSEDGQGLWVGEQWGMSSVMNMFQFTGLFEMKEPKIPAGAYLVTLDIQTGLEVGRVTASARPQDILGLGDGTALLNLYERGLGFWDGEQVHTISSGLRTDDERMIYEIALSPDKTRLITSHATQEVRLWEVANLLTGTAQSQILPRSSDTQSPYALAVNQNQQLVIGELYGALELWDLTDNTRLWRINGALAGGRDRVGSASAIAFRPDGTEFVAGSGTGGMIIYDVVTGASIRTLGGEAHEVRALVYTQDGQQLYQGGNSTQVMLWDLTTNGMNTRYTLLAESNDSGVSVAVSQDSIAAIIGGDIRVWEITSRQERYVLNDQPDIFGATFSPDGATLLTWSTGGGNLILRDALTGQPISVLKNTHGPVLEASYSPEGSRVVTSERSLLRVDTEAETVFQQTGFGDAVVVRDAQTLEALVTFNILQRPFDSAWRVLFSPDGNHILIGTFNGFLLLYDAQTGVLVRDFGRISPELISAIDFSPDGKWVAAASSTGSVWIYEVETSTLLAELRQHLTIVSGVAFSPDGQLLVTASHDGSILLWDMTAAKFGQVLRRLTLDIAINDVTFSRDGHTVLYTDAVGGVHIWDALPELDEMLHWLYANRWLRPLSCGERIAYRLTVQCAADGSMLQPTLNAAYITATPTVTFTPSPDFTQTTPTPSPTATEIPSPLSLIYSVRWFSDGKKIISSSDDGTVRLWDVESGQQEVMIDGINTDGAINAYLSPDETRLVVYAFDGGARIYDASTGAFILELPHAAPVESARWSLDSTKIATGATDGSLTLWDAETGSQIWRQVEHTNTLYWLDWSPDGAQIAAVSHDKTGSIWTADGKLITRLEGHSAEVSDIRWSPDGARVCTAGWDNTGRIWDVQTGEALVILRGHTNWVVRCQWSLDGHSILTMSLDATVRFWDADTGEQTRLIDDFQTAALAAYAPDGQSVAVSGYGGGGLTIYELTTGESRAMPVIGIETIGLNPPFWSPDGTKLAVGGRNGRFYIWSLTDDTVIRFPQADSFVPTVTPDATILASRPSATPTPELPLLAYGQLEAEMPVGRPVWWRIEARQGEIIEVVAASGFGVRLELYQPDGQLLVEGMSLTAFSIRSDEKIEALMIPQSGVYTLKAESAQGDGGSYTLTLNSSIHSTPTPTAPPNLEKSISLGLTRDSLAFAQGNRYRLQEIAGLTLNIAAQANFDVELWVYDSQGNLLAENDDAPQEGMNARIESVVVPADGILLIDVRSWNNRESGSFTLTIDSINP